MPASSTWPPDDDADDAPDEEADVAPDDDMDVPPDDGLGVPPDDDADVPPDEGLGVPPDDDGDVPLDNGLGVPPDDDADVPPGDELGAVPDDDDAEVPPVDEVEPLALPVACPEPHAAQRAPSNGPTATSARRRKEHFDDLTTAPMWTPLDSTLQWRGEHKSAQTWCPAPSATCPATPELTGRWAT